MIRTKKGFSYGLKKKYINIVDSVVLRLKNHDVFFYIVSFNGNLYLLISQLGIDKISYKNQLYREIEYEHLESLINDVDDYVKEIETEDPLISLKLKEDINLEHGRYKIDKTKIYILFVNDFNYLNSHIEKIKKKYKIKLTGIIPTVYDKSEIFDYYY